MDFNHRMKDDYTLAKKWLTTKRGFPEYNELCLVGDTEKWGFAAPGTS